MIGQWTIRGRAFSPAHALRKDGLKLSPFVIWGIVNVTPDSFYDGGRHPTTESALEHARKLLADGAGVLDIGGASSRPGSEDVPAEREVERILPVIKRLLTHPSPPPVSVDTWRANVAEVVLAAGADIINDISACAWEPELIDVVAGHKPGYVLMHSQGRPDTMQAAPRYENVLDDVLDFFERKMKLLVQAGLPESNIILDPGIGFGKRLEHNLELLAHLDRLQSLGRPVLLGISNKSLFGDMFGLSREERGEMTSVCTALAAQRGILHHRVHNVASSRMALELVRALGGKVGEAS